MIKSKNGEEYKLRKPNPIMKEQETWDEYTLHNFFWADYVVKHKKLKQEQLKQEQQEQQEQEQQQEQQQQQEQKKKVKNKTKKIDKKQNEINALCLFSKNYSEEDPVYGEIKKRTEYVDKETIIIKVIEQNDLFMIFYSEKKIEINSIIFPQNKGKRWWKVKKEKDNTYECVPSDLTPSFD